jgi:uncharacterized membrane protein
MQRTSKGVAAGRISSIDLLRGLVMVIMALDHVRMYFGFGTWYSEPTNLTTTTSLLFFTRWVTHFCAPVFVFLAGTSAFLSGMNKPDRKRTAWFLMTRGIWLVAVELIVVTFGWTFDVRYSFLILQVIWAIGISMIVLSALVFLPPGITLLIGVTLVFGHNLLDFIRFQGEDIPDFIWYALHQPQTIILDQRIISVVYPVLPWMGLMALGYVSGNLYKPDFPQNQRKSWLMIVGSAATLLFILLRWFNGYGEPQHWHVQGSAMYSLMSFLNTTKYPPSLQFLLMTMGPALLFLAWSERRMPRENHPFIVFGSVPFFFYVIHIYFIHTLALLALAYAGWDWREYILSASRIMSGKLSTFGFGLGSVYLIWLVVVAALYPICRWYKHLREINLTKWWLRYL